MQSLFDLAITRCGSAQAAYDIAARNGIDLTEPYRKEDIQVMPDIVNREVVTFFATQKNQPDTNC